MAQGQYTSDELRRMAEYLRAQGMSQSQIDNILGGDESEFRGMTNVYEMSKIPASEALKNDARNAWGAAGNALSGYIAGREQKDYKKFNQDWKKAMLERRNAALNAANPDLAAVVRAGPQQLAGPGMPGMEEMPQQLAGPTGLDPDEEEARRRRLAEMYPELANG